MREGTVVMGRAYCNNREGSIVMGRDYCNSRML